MRYKTTDDGLVPFTLEEEAEWDARVAANEAQAAADSLAREAAERKAARQAAVDAIVVTTQAGNAFDGDEVSQGRMSRAILSMQAAGATETQWVLADNQITDVTIAELTEALILAGQEQTRIWMADR
jgi:hypothetical protein